MRIAQIFLTIILIPFFLCCSSEKEKIEPRQPEDQDRLIVKSIEIVCSERDYSKTYEFSYDAQGRCVKLVTDMTHGSFEGQYQEIDFTYDNSTLNADIWLEMWMSRAREEYDRDEWGTTFNAVLGAGGRVAYAEYREMWDGELTHTIEWKPQYENNNIVRLSYDYYNNLNDYEFLRHHQESYEFTWSEGNLSCITGEDEWETTIRYRHDLEYQPLNIDLIAALTHDDNYRFYDMGFGLGVLGYYGNVSPALPEVIESDWDEEIFDYTIDEQGIIREVEISRRYGTYICRIEYMNL